MRTEPKASYRTVQYEYAYRYTPNIYIYIYIYIYTATQKFGISKIFMFFMGVSSAHQGCIYSIKNTEKIGMKN